MQKDDIEYDTTNQEDELEDESLAQISLMSGCDGKFKKFGSVFVKGLSLALDDVGVSVQEHDKIFEIIENSFWQIIRLSNSVTQIKGPATQLLYSYVEALHQKVQHMAESIVLAQDPDIVTPTKAQLLGAQKRIMEQIATRFASVLESNLVKQGLTYHSAHLIIVFVLRVVSPLNKVITLETCPSLNWQLSLVADQLFNPAQNRHFRHDCQLLLSFIENAPNYDRESYTKALIENTTFQNSRLYLLGLIHASGKGCDSKLRLYLVEQSEKLAFNDKNKDAYNSSVLFEPFYRSIDEKTYMSEMHSNTQFCVNRSSLLISNITHMVTNFGFKLSTETAIALTYQLVTKDQITNHNTEVQKLFKVVCERVNEPSTFSPKILGFIVAEYEKVKLSASVSSTDKIKMLSLACSCANILNSEPDQCAAATIDLLLNSKEQLEVTSDIVAIIKRSSPKVQQALTAGAQKIQFSTQVQTLIEIGNLEVSSVILNKLAGLNFEIAANTSVALTMTRYLSEVGMSQKLVENDAAAKYIFASTSLLNQPATLKRLSRKDIENHLITIQNLLQLELKQQYISTLETVLIEYLVNNEYVFRGKQLWQCYQHIQRNWSETHLVQVLKQVFVRIQRTTGEKVDSEFKQSSSLPKKIRNFLSFVIPRGITLQQDTLIAVLQVISHPSVSSNAVMLKTNSEQIIKICKMPWKAMIKDNCDVLIKQFLRDRTGILSPDKTVRQVAINVLALVSWAGLLSNILPEIMPIFNYKPVEMLDKLEKLLISEFDKISHYDLMFYAEMTRDMIGMYKDKDEKLIRQALCEKTESQQEIIEESKTQEETSIGASDDMDPVIMAMLAKASKSKKGKGKAAPTGGKSATTAKPTSTPAKPAVSQQKTESAPEISKEERNRLDRKQMIHFITEMREVKARQIKACYEMLTLANRSTTAITLNYQELTLAYLTLPLLKLLNLTATRFDSIFFTQNLLNDNRESPFFKIKGSLLQGLIAVADNKLSYRATNEISQCLHNLEKNADFTEMGVGSLKICLTIANFVLKDPSVNLSIKEIGLVVAQSILEDNQVVQMIDLVRLTINMLKTNYISHNLNGFLRKLIRRTNKIEIALLLQPLFEYQPVPRKVLLTELYAYDEPLFNPIWFSTQMWILLFDEELGGLARKIFNKFGVTLRSECLEITLEKETRNVFHYLRDQNFGIFSLTTKAVGSAMELFRQSPKLKKIIDDLITFYRSEWKIIEEESAALAEQDFYSNSKVQQRLRSDQRMNRISIPQIFNRTAKLLQPQNFETVLTFLITESCQDQNDEVKDASNKAALAIIKAQGEQYANQLLSVLETFLNATEGPASKDSSKNQAVILLGHLAQFLGDTAQKKLVSSYEKLVELLSKSTTSLTLQRAISKCIPQLAKFFPDKAKVYLTNQLINLRQSKEEIQVRASAFAVAGLIKSLGMSYSVEIDLFGIIAKECFESKRTEPIRKQAGLYFFDAASFIMGHSFEVFLPHVFPLILSAISDQKEPVRLAALAALKTIMATFSNYAIKQALPQFLAELKNDNWRSKFSTVEALGNMAFCAPKQISSFLPQIVKGLREVLNDTHEKVHEAAIEAIKKIGSVIKCPEIGDMLEIIIKALANTNTHLNEALNLMLETSFAHAIDAPSLSLLVPLLDAGLTMHDNSSKQMAATLMGNICSLTQDPQDLIPYMSILVPAIKQSLFDAIPEIRASAAKALGRLSRGLGQAYSVELLAWLREHLDKQATSSAERSGAAQGFAEMISSHGLEYFEHHINEVISKSQDSQGFLRESYRGVLVFLPGCFDKYVDYLPMLVPIMIEGLADETDEVRKVSMRNVKICIKQFAKSSPYQLVNPVMRMMFSTDFRVRESSSILMFQLVKELENDIIKATPKYVDNDTKQRILSSMFILKYDPIEKVYTQAGQIWKSIVDNQLLVLRQVIDTCIQIIFQIIQSPSLELQEMGLSCIRGIVEKMGEKLVLRAIEIFESLLEKATDKTQSVGICRVMFNMAGSASYRLLQIISPKLVSIMDPYLSAESEELREWSSKVLITLFQRQPEKAFVDPILEKSVLIKLKQLTRDNNEPEAERLITTLKYLVDKAAGLKIEDRMLVLCDITDKRAVFSIAQARIIKALASTFASKVFTKKFYYGVLVALQEELSAPVIDDVDRIQHVLMAYAELMANLPENENMQTNEEIERFLGDCQTLNRPGFYLDLLSHYCSNTTSNFEKLAEQYMENVLKYINYPDDKLVQKVIAAITAIMEKLPKENQMLLVPLIRRQIEINGVQIINTLHSLQSEEGNVLQHVYKKKSTVLGIFKNPAGVQNIVNYVQAAILHGSVNVRIDAAFTFKYVLDFSEASAIKKEIIKICGALIRVVNDKFPQELKMQIFLAFKIIQQRYGDSAKAMAAQLQTTFLKALGDNSTTVHVQRIVIENLILLVKGQPRVDPIVKELVALLDGPKIDGQQKELVSECLALLIRAKGKSITSAMSETITNQLGDLISNADTGSVNDIVLANCGVALAYLSAQAADTSQMMTLFNTFKGANTISVSIKFGILTNGNETIEKSKMAKELLTLLVSWLQSDNGLEERPVSNQDDEIFRFRGAFELIGHLTNSFARREWCQAVDSPYLALMFQSINQAATLKTYVQQKSVSANSFALLLKVLGEIPVKSDKLSSELTEFIKDGFTCIQKFYLDHVQLYPKCTDAILNLLQLTYDGFLDVQNIKVVDRHILKEATMQKCLEGVIHDDMKMYALDIVFKKK